jgi:NADH dehydrogenase (ubiquinone) 1 beta subcomplex subunit 9
LHSFYLQVHTTHKTRVSFLTRSKKEHAHTHKYVRNENMSSATSLLLKDLPSKTRALRLYRHSLKTCLSWCVMRDIFYTERDRIRNEFESNRDLTSAQAIKKIEEGFETLDSYAHPDPYIIPTMYGGSKYARNPPVPGEVHVIRDFGRERESIPKE